MSTFTDLGVPEDLVAALAARGITAPFPVQSATIPDLLAGHDVCGRAPTGSGKTIAFGLPLVARVAKARPRQPSALVLAPTRELAAQIDKELAPLAAARSRRVATVYGGVGYEPQKRALRRGVDVLVACPGRLEDLIAQRAVDLSRVGIVVVDEADRMADMGFLPAVRRLLDATAEPRQTVLFSATLDGDVAVLTRRYQRDPRRHEVAGVDGDGATAAEHRFEEVAGPERLERAAEVIGAEGATIVFCRTRRGADKVTRRLGQLGVRAAAIHGGRSQGQRDRALSDFGRGSVQALVATDVAARGIHVDDVACVVHFDPPVDAKTYVHRSGRTARKGAGGVVVSFVGPDQHRESRRMRRELDAGHPARLESPDRPARSGARRPRSTTSARSTRSTRSARSTRSTREHEGAPGWRAPALQRLSSTGRRSGRAPTDASVSRMRTPRRRGRRRVVHRRRDHRPGHRRPRGGPAGEPARPPGPWSR